MVQSSTKPDLVVKDHGPASDSCKLLQSMQRRGLLQSVPVVGACVHSSFGTRKSDSDLTPHPTAALHAEAEARSKGLAGILPRRYREVLGADRIADLIAG